MRMFRVYCFVWGVIAACILPFGAFAESQLGASLYIAPLQDNPRAGSNFTASVKVDSLAEPVNAVRGVLSFDKERLEVVTTSKIGSVLNLWIEEPRFSNADGTVRFQGGVPAPGFIGGGGGVLHVIFHAKGEGPVAFVWKEGEVLAADGKGTNVLTNLQNLNLTIDPPFSAPAESRISDLLTNSIFVLNLVLLFFILCIGIFFLVRVFIRSHDRRVYSDIQTMMHEEYEHHQHHAEEGRGSVLDHLLKSGGEHDHTSH